MKLDEKAILSSVDSQIDSIEKTVLARAAERFSEIADKVAELASSLLVVPSVAVAPKVATAKASVVSTKSRVKSYLGEHSGNLRVGTVAKALGVSNQDVYDNLPGSHKRNNAWIVKK